jgi:hypothetical protein
MIQEKIKQKSNWFPYIGLGAGLLAAYFLGKKQNFGTLGYLGAGIALPALGYTAGSILSKRSNEKEAVTKSIDEKSKPVTIDDEIQALIEKITKENNFILTEKEKEKTQKFLNSLSEVEKQMFIDTMNVLIKASEKSKKGVDPSFQDFIETSKKLTQKYGEAAYNAFNKKFQQFSDTFDRKIM